MTICVPLLWACTSTYRALQHSTTGSRTMLLHSMSSTCDYSTVRMMGLWLRKWSHVRMMFKMTEPSGELLLSPGSRKRTGPPSHVQLAPGVASRGGSGNAAASGDPYHWVPSLNFDQELKSVSRSLGGSRAVSAGHFP